MSRKKSKQTRKYKPKNEFRRNKSPSANGHFNYVFGETDTQFKSMGLTTHPRKDIPHYKLSKNPNPNDNSVSYLQLKVLSTNKKYFSDPQENWAFDKRDIPVVRHNKKNYKKSTNRKPKDWYVKKRKWNTRKKPPKK